MGRKTYFKEQVPAVKALSKAFFLAILLLLCVLWSTILSGGQNVQLVAPAGIASPTPYQFAVGDRTIYQLVYESSSSSDFRILFGDPKSYQVKQKDMPPGLAFTFKTTVRGNLTATVLEIRADSILVAYRMHNPHITLIANGHSDIDQAETIRSDLGKEIFVHMNLQGRILSVLIDPSVGNLAQSYARTIIASKQFVFPIEQIPENGQWDSREEDTSGKYIARYQILKSKGKKAKEASSDSFRKTKIRYLENRKKPQMGQIDIPKTIVPRGSFIASFNVASGYLSSLKGSESQVILVNKKKVGHVTNKFQIVFQKTEKLAASDVALLKDVFSTRESTVPASPLFIEPSPEEAETGIQKRELGDATLESLLAELKNAEAASDPQFNSTALYLKLKALIYLHPEACEALGKVLISAKAKSLTMSLLPKALSTVGHSQAQAALVEAVKAHSKDKFALFALLTPLASVSEATQQTEEALWEMAFTSPDPEIAAMAQLALGAQARRLAAVSPERAAKIVDRFTSEIKASSSPEKTKQLLLALGNAGSSRALPEISRFMTDPSTDLRATALRALRFIDSPQAEAMLITALNSDKDSVVRRETATALGYREMTQSSFTAQKRAFLNDSDVSVRLRVLENLWKSHEAFPEIRGVVKKAAAKDSSQDVQKAARNIIAQYPKGYFK